MAKRCASRPNTTPLDTGKRIIFTGPDGTGNYQSKLPDHVHYIGARTPPIEGTSDAMYLWRPAPHNPPPWSHRHCFAGEIGWGVENLGFFSQRVFSWVKPIMPEVFPPVEEYELINRYRNPRLLQAAKQIRTHGGMSSQKTPVIANMSTRLKRYPPPDPQYLYWRDSPNYQPIVPTMDRPETSPWQMKS